MSNITEKRSCGSCDAKVPEVLANVNLNPQYLRTKAAMCEFCPSVIKSETSGIYKCSKLDLHLTHYELGKVDLICPLGRWPDKDGFIYWAWWAFNWITKLPLLKRLKRVKNLNRWWGVPWPIRRRIAKYAARMAYKNRMSKEQYPGCGCNVFLKKIWLKIAFWIPPEPIIVNIEEVKKVITDLNAQNVPVTASVQPNEVKKEFKDESGLIK
jgi:hypothetical protein